MMDLMQIAQATNGRLQGNNVRVEGVESDSRRVAPGMLFVALPGDKFNGHDFVAQVAAQGAVAALVSQPIAVDIPTIQVSDTRIAMGQLARWWRQQQDIKLIAVTGSNGKTTTKEMLAAILQVHTGSTQAVLATAGNFNNDIGMPLTLLRLRASHRYAVIEMGMSHLGEIDYLTRLALPDVAVIINAGTAHIGELGSRENIAKAKGEIYAGLNDDGIAVLHADSAFAAYWRGLNAGRRIVDFGLHADADVRAELDAQDDSRFVLHVQGQALPVQLKVPGRHNVSNALAAAAASLAAGISAQTVVQGLSAFDGVKGRLQLKVAANGACVIDDTYNANPDSMKAALDVLRGYDRTTWFVMGDMGELGDDAEIMHKQIGEYAKACGIAHLYALGLWAQAAVTAFGSGAQHFATPEALIAALRSAIDANDVVLVKGSRFMRMERVVDGLIEAQAALKTEK